MIVENSHIEVVSNQQMVGFGLDNSNGHLFSVLSRLYSKPVESTIREVCTNCVDAHIMSHNEDKPFIIKLPNFEANIYNISFRDFGPGLTHEQINDIYRWYGRSTKTKSNNVTGCLGLGSKSPYSISSTFYVKSYNNGKCSQYTCSKDNDGKPNLSEEPIIFDTQEENGLEVIIPFYKEEDFQSILKKVLKYFKVKPLVYKQMGELNRDEPIKIEWETFADTAFITPTIKMPKIYKNGVNLFKDHKIQIKNEVIQLQIYYPLDTNLIMSTIERFNKLYIDEKNETIKKFKISQKRINLIKKMFNKGLQLHADPGRISFAPSRESIEYTELTLIYIVKELNKAARILEKQLNSKFENINTYEKAFKEIYLGKSDYDLIVSNGFIPESPLLAAFNNVFSHRFKIKDHPSKFENIMDITYLSKHDVTKYYDSKPVCTPMQEFNLNGQKSNIANLFDDSYKLPYYDLLDQSGQNLNEGGKVLFTSFATPFTRQVNKLCLNKILFMAYTQLKEEVLSRLEEIYNMDDKTYLNYSVQNHNYAYLNIKREFDIPFEDVFITETNEDGSEIKTIHRYGFRSSKESFQEYYDMVKEKTFPYFLRHMQFLVGKHSSREATKKYNIDKLLGLICRYILPVSNNNTYFINKLDLNKLDVPDDKLLDAFNNNELLDYRSFEIAWSYTYRKFIKYYIKNKKQTLKKIENKVDFNNFIPNILTYNFPDFSDMGKRESIIPLNNIFKIRGKEVLSMIDLISQYCMWVYARYYPNELDAQIEYTKTFDKKEFIINALTNFAIPLEYAKNIRESRLIPVAIRSSSYKRTNTFEWTKNDLSNAKVLDNYDVETNVYKFDLVPDASKLEEMKNMANELIVEFKNTIKWGLEYTQKNIYYRKDDIRTVLCRNFVQNYNGYILKLEALIENYNKMPDSMVIEKYNATIRLINQISILSSDIVSDFNLPNEFNKSSQSLRFNMVRPVHRKIYNFLVNDINGVDHFGIYENCTGEIEDEFTDEITTYQYKELYVTYCFTEDQFGELFIHSRSGKPFVLPIERAEEIYQEYFPSRKFLLNDGNWKISVGQNPLPEKYDLNILKKLLTDGNTKTIRKSYSNKSYAFEPFIKSEYPDFIIVRDIDYIPKIFHSQVYNMIPIILDLPTKPIFSKMQKLNHSITKFKESHYHKKIYPNININFGDKFEPETSDRKLEGFAKFITSGGVITDEFNDFKKFLKVFGNKKIVNGYNNLVKEQFKELHEVIMIYLNLLHKKEIPLFKSYLNNEIDAVDLDRISKIQSKMLDQIKDLNSGFTNLYHFRNDYISCISRGEQDTIKKLREDNPILFMTKVFEEYRSDRSRIKLFINSLGEVFDNISMGRRTNISNIKEKFYNYNNPEPDPKQEIVNDFDGVDGFLKKVEKIEKRNILQHKINKRTSEKIQLKEKVDYTKNTILTTMRFINEMGNKEINNNVRPRAI